MLIRRERVKFKKKKIRWLEICLDSQLKFTAHINKRLIRAKIAEIQVKRLNNFYELAPRLVKWI